MHLADVEQHNGWLSNTTDISAKVGCEQAQPTAQPGPRPKPGLGPVWKYGNLEPNKEKKQNYKIKIRSAQTVGKVLISTIKQKAPDPFSCHFRPLFPRAETCKH